MKKIKAFHPWSLLISIFAVTLITTISSCKKTMIEHSVFGGDGLDIRVSDGDDQFYKTLLIYRSDGKHEKKMFTYHEDRLKVFDDSCFRIDESQYSSEDVKEEYNLGKNYLPFFDSEYPFIIVHFFNINKEATFRKDRYFVFRTIGEDSISLIKTFVGKRLSYEYNYDDNGFSGFTFKTDNYFTKKFFWGYTPELDLKLPDTKFYLNDDIKKIEWN